MTGLGWKAVGVPELTVLLGLDADLWGSWVRDADVLLVNGGDPLYLVHWLR
jgi:dipeptidase E